MFGNVSRHLKSVWEPSSTSVWTYLGTRIHRQKAKTWEIFRFCSKTFRDNLQRAPELKFVIEEKSWKSMKVVPQFRSLVMYPCTQIGSHGGAGWFSFTFEVSGHISEHFFFSKQKLSNFLSKNSEFSMPRYGRFWGDFATSWGSRVVCMGRERSP